MISDVISDAVVEIARYQAEMPDIYSEHYKRIERVKLEMDLLRAHFDRPPNCKEAA